jgi:hypothetical protein
MIKELFLAIIIGAILGLGITGGYLNLHNKDKTPKNNTIITEPTLVPTIITDNNLSPTSSPKKSDSIKISSPEDNSLLNTEKTIISGITTPDSHIIISTISNTFIGQSDKDGNFSITVKLDSGFNIIKISSIDTNDNQKDTQLNVTYSTAKI